MIDRLRDSLLLQLQRSATASPAWAGFLDQCCTDIGLSYASLIFRRGPGRRVDAEYHAGPIDSDAVRQLYRSQFGDMDPVLYFMMEANRPYRLQELLRTSQIESHPYFQKFLAPLGLAQMMSARVVEVGGDMAWLTWCRGVDQPEFSSDEQQLFASLLPHMAVGLNSYITLEGLRVTAAIGQHVSTRFDMATLALTATGRVLARGPATDRLLANSPLLSITGDGHLHFSRTTARRQFADLITTVLERRQAKAMLLETDGAGLEMLLTPFEKSDRQGIMRPDLVLYLRPIQQENQPARPTGSLSEMFGLTAMETEIAIGLASGRSMADLAGDLGLTENTVRSYSKSIYAKLGVRRQVDLVRRILISVTQLG